jgi:SAM-dependent methyltransferase
MKSKIYKQAKYYEIAFDFVNIPKQINLFEKFISKYSKIPVRTVLDIACGPALQLREFAKRGYKSIGLDISKEMIEYLKQASRDKKTHIETIIADMTNFKLKKKADFAYLLMGSIAYLKNNNGFINHLNSVSKNLNPGGIYLIENLAMTWADQKIWQPQKWQIRRGNIKIDATYKISLKDELTQTIRQTIKLRVKDGGKTMIFEDNDDLKIIMPQEFKTIVELQNNFEFIGFFERWSVRKLSKSNNNNVIVLRKR